MAKGSFRIAPMERSDEEAILALFGARHEHFTEAEIVRIRACLNFRSGYRVTVALSAVATVVGCVIWREAHYDVEVYWLVAASDRQGIGHALVESVARSNSDKSHLLIKTMAPGAQCRSHLYNGVSNFLDHSGFKEVAQLRGYWGKDESAALWIRELR